MISKRDQNRIKELIKEIPFYGELSTSESKKKESYKRLVVELKKELEATKAAAVAQAEAEEALRAVKTALKAMTTSISSAQDLIQILHSARPA